MSSRAAPLPSHVYILTIWAEPGQGHEAPQMWRFRLHDPRTGQQHGFASLTELIIALHTALLEPHPAPRSDRE